MYESSLHSYLERYFERRPIIQTLDKGKAPQRTGSMASLLAQTRPRPMVQEKVGWRDELTSYLNLRKYILSSKTYILIDLGTDDEDPCHFWKQHEAQFPTLAALARDIFSIPATGAGVERLFSSARDICHYRRGSLNTTTI